MLALPQEYAGSICEVKDLDNNQLTVGRIIKIDHEALEIAARDDDMMPLLSYRMAVKLYIHNPQHGTRIQVGTVYLSTDNFLRVEDVRPLESFERRGAFRVSISTSGTLTPLLTEEQQAQFDTELANASPQQAEALLARSSFEVQIMDVSLSGMRLASHIPLTPGESYLIDFYLLDSEMTLCLRVQRLIMMPNGETQYGCVFFDISERQMDQMCKELFRLQRIERNRRRNSPTSI